VVIDKYILIVIDKYILIATCERPVGEPRASVCTQRLFGLVSKYRQIDSADAAVIVVNFHQALVASLPRAGSGRNTADIRQPALPPNADGSSRPKSKTPSQDTGHGRYFHLHKFRPRLAAEKENNRGDFSALIISTFRNYH
jgi:hypothetical protein